MSVCVDACKCVSIYVWPMQALAFFCADQCTCFLCVFVFVCLYELVSTLESVFVCKSIVARVRVCLCVS